MVSTPLKNMLVKMGSSSPIFGVKKKSLSCHQPVINATKNSTTRKATTGTLDLSISRLNRHSWHSLGNVRRVKRFAVCCSASQKSLESSEGTLQGINTSHLGKRKIIFKMPFFGDMLVPWRVRLFGC